MGNYALLAGQGGETLLNAAATQAIYFRNNHADVAHLTAGAFIWDQLNTFQTASLISGFTGSGLGLDNGVANPGQTTAEFDNMIIRGRMRVYELLIHQTLRPGEWLQVFCAGQVTAVLHQGVTLVRCGE